MDKKILPDTPWHIGYAKKQPHDPRRHKARCMYYDKGECEIGRTRCHGSAHCSRYKEREIAKYDSISYGISHENKLYFSQEIRDFCRDSYRKERWKYLKNITECPLCSQTLENYNPLRYMAKRCSKCKILFVDYDVYKTYTRDINLAMGTNILCIVGIGKLASSIIEINNKNVSPANGNKSKKKESTIKSEDSINTLGNDPRFQEIFKKFKNE